MYEVDKIQYLQIGVQGENDATDIEIDMSAWAEKYPDAVFHVLFKPYNASTPSPMLTTYEAGVLTWTVGVGATAVVGVGYTEIRAQDSETGLVKKSKIIPTAVENSVSGVETTPPASYQEWVTAVLNAGADAKTGAAAVLAYSHGAAIMFEIGDSEAPEGKVGHLLFYYKEEGDESWQGPLDLGSVDVYAMAVEEGYTGTKAQWVQSMEDAEENAQKSEKYATGKLNGTDVSSDDPTYHNNSKYYSEQAAGDASDSEAYAAGTRGGTEVDSDDPAYHNNAGYYAGQAAGSATSAAASAADALEHTQSVIETWLGNNIDPESGYALDRTLALQNAAAPADMVGDLKKALIQKSPISLVNKGNVLATAEKVEGHRYRTSADVNATYKFYRMPVVSGTTYYFTSVDSSPYFYKPRYISKAGTLIEEYDNVKGIEEYTADFTGDLFVTFKMANEAYGYTLGNYKNGSYEHPLLGVLSDDISNDFKIAPSKFAVYEIIRHIVSKVITDKNMLLFSPIYERQYYRPSTETSPAYFSVQNMTTFKLYVASGNTYVISPGMRFVIYEDSDSYEYSGSSSGTTDDYEYTATKTGFLYICFAGTSPTNAYVYDKASVTNAQDEVGTYGQPILSVANELESIEEEIVNIKSEIYETEVRCADYSKLTSTASNSKTRLENLPIQKSGYVYSVTINAESNDSSAVLVFALATQSSPNASVKVLAKKTINLKAGTHEYFNGVDFTYNDRLPVGSVVGLYSSNSKLYYGNDGGTSFIIDTTDPTVGTEYSSQYQSYDVSIGVKVRNNRIQDNCDALVTLNNKVCNIPNEVNRNVLVYLDSDNFVADVTLNQKASLLTLNRQPDSGNYNVCAVAYVDFEHDTIGLYKGHKPSDTPESKVSTSFSFTEGKEYYIQFNKTDGLTYTLTVMDAVTFQSASVTQTTTYIGSGWGKRSVNVISGSVTINHVHDISTQPYAVKLCMTGDSYIEGASLNDDKNSRYAYLIKQELDGNVFISAQGGSKMQLALEMMNNYIFDLCYPKYFLIAFGMNDTDYDAWLKNAQTAISILESKNIIPILATIPPVTGESMSGNNQVHMQMNTWIRNHDYPYIDIAKMLSSGNDGVTAGSSFFLSDGVHPTAASHLLIFNRAKIDLPFLFS